MKLLCVEDGSVDVGKLEKQVKGIAKVVVYRQGSNIPFVLEVSDESEKYKAALDILSKSIENFAKKYENDLENSESLFNSDDINGQSK